MLSNKINFLFLGVLSIFCTSSTRSADKEINQASPGEEQLQILIKNPIGYHLNIISIDEKDADMVHGMILYWHKQDASYINAQRKEHLGYTPLHTAIQRKHHISTIKYLVARGADITKTNNKGYTPLELACISPYPCDSYNFDSIIFLANTEEANPSIKERNEKKKGANLLHLIMKNTTIKANMSSTTLSDVLKAFTDAGYNINAQDEYGNTPIHYAIGTLCRYMTTANITHAFGNCKADVTIKNSYDEEPKEYASKQRS